MFDNIGGKIKGVSKLACYLGIGGCLLMGISLLVDEYVRSGLAIAIFGSLMFWISSLSIYGFGQLVENSDILAGRMPAKGPKATDPSAQSAGGTQKKKAKVTGPIPPDAVIFPTRTETEIKCPKCGFAQIGYRDLCRSCKAPFFYKDEIE